MIISAASDYRAAAQRILPPFLFHYMDLLFLYIQLWLMLQYLKKHFLQWLMFLLGQ